MCACVCLSARAGKFRALHSRISTVPVSMSSPVRSGSAGDDYAPDLVRVRSHIDGDDDDDRGGPPKSKKARTQERRATQACSRCRQQKLRCPGDWPCVRCVKANKECDFGKGNSGNIAPPSNVTTGTAKTHEQQHQQERRAPQACLRCRKQKLRCLGGRPCARCVKANKGCDFSKPGQVSATPNTSTNMSGKEAEHPNGLAAGLNPGANGTDLVPPSPAGPALSPATARFMSTNPPAPQ